MRRPDIENFYAAFDAVQSLYPTRANQDAVAAQREIWFRALSAYPLADICAAFEAHVKDPARGRFAPLPADVIAQIESRHAHADDRPGPEEAWAIAVRAADEAATVVWTNETAEAWAIAKPVLDLGDEVGARMAFRECYTRQVEQARRSRTPAGWFASLGHDPALRAAEVEKAVAHGLLRRGDYPQLTAPSAQIPLLEMAGRADAPTGARAMLKLIRDRLVAGRNSREIMQWDRELRDREAAGEILTAFQRDCYRDALDGNGFGPSDAGVIFTPPPPHTLPPGMRPAARPAAAEYEAFAGEPAPWSAA